MSRETFTDLLAANLPSVRRLVQTRLRTSAYADDVLQQALLRAFAHREQLRVQSKFKSWLWSIALNEIRAFLRGTRPGVSLDEFPNLELADRAPSPFAKCEQRERAEWLQAGMARLTERDRTAIRLVDLNGLSIAEAADALALSRAAVKSVHFRARQRLACAVRSAPESIREYRALDPHGKRNAKNP
jgi:RNA polymerase sigma-70 factor (ECF subfamily)